MTNKKTNKILLLFICIFINIGSSFSSPKEKDTIIWPIVDWPPMMKLVDGNIKKKSGVAVDLLNIFKSKMTKYNHKEEKMLWSRVWSDIKDGKKICNIMSLKNNKRHDFTIFSDPLMIVLQIQVIMKKKVFESVYGSKKRISLEKLIINKKLSGILEMYRSYTDRLDLVLNRVGKKKNYNRITTNSKNILKMLKANRIDYFLEYPAIIRHLIKATPYLQDDYYLSEIIESSPVVYGYVACPKNRWGINIISEINKIIKSEKSKDYYKKIIVNGDDLASEKMILGKAYSNFLKASN